MGSALLIHYSTETSVPAAVINAFTEFFDFKKDDIAFIGKNSRCESLKKRAFWVFQSLDTLQDALLDGNDDKRASLFLHLKNAVHTLYAQLEKKISDTNALSLNINYFQQYLLDIEARIKRDILPFFKNSHPFFQEIDPNILAQELMYYADSYHVQKQKRSAIATFSKGVRENELIVQFDRPLPAISDAIAREYLNAKANSEHKPLWYVLMPALEKIFFDKMQKSFPVSSISSKLRSLPGVVNFSKTQTIAINEEGHILSISPQHYRSSMVVSRDLMKLKGSKEIKRQLLLDTSVRNIENIIENHISMLNNQSHLNFEQISDMPILLQSLVTPFKLGVFQYDPDYSMATIKKKAMDVIRENGCRLKIDGIDRIVKFKHLLDTNHPINLGRHFCGTGRFLEINGAHNQATIKKIISLSERGSAIVREAGQQLKSLLSKVPSGLDFAHREMHMSALEEFIITRLGGISAGGCDSGKDRKAVEILYFQSLEEFLRIHHYLPSIDHPHDRIIFAKICANLFLTRHQELCAGLNSPGSEGVKTAYLFLPKDIIQEIQKQSRNTNILKESHEIAKTNDIRLQLKFAKQASSPLSFILKAMIGLYQFILIALRTLKTTISSVFFAPQQNPPKENHILNNRLEGDCLRSP